MMLKIKRIYFNLKKKNSNKPNSAPKCGTEKNTQARVFDLNSSFSSFVNIYFVNNPPIECAIFKIKNLIQKKNSYVKLVFLPK